MKRFALIVAMGLLGSAEAHADTIVAQYEGNGTQAMRPFTVSGPWEVQWNNLGSRLTISIRDEAGGIFAIATIGAEAGPGVSYQPVPGTYYLDIQAAGSWQITVVMVD